MTHTVSCQNDAVNYNYDVIVDDKIATKFPYTSWYMPHGVSSTTAQAAAENLTLNLSDVFATNANTFTVDVNDTGSGFEVLVNEHDVYTYAYSSVWVVGGLIASKTTAAAEAYQLGQTLSSILQAAYHQKG